MKKIKKSENFSYVKEKVTGGKIREILSLRKLRPAFVGSEMWGPIWKDETVASKD